MHFGLHCGALTRFTLISTLIFLLIRAQKNDDLSRPTQAVGPTVKTIQFPPEFLQSFRISKSQRDPSHFLDIYLPDNLEVKKSNSDLPFGEFREFIARVTDITTVVEPSMRDGNRTFRLSIQDPSAIRIHGLNPGHRYSISIFGRIDDQSALIKEESVVMDPIPLDLNVEGAVQAFHNNITIRAVKAERVIQDKFSVKYFQLDPLKRFPTLDVYDIQEQRNIEIYLGNLSPGRDYDISITSVREDMQSKPWRKVVTTKPLSPTNLTVSELNSTCIALRWSLSPESGADRFRVAYGLLKNTGNMIKAEIPFGLKHEAVLCQGIHPGQTYVFALVAEKSTQVSEPATVSHTVRPLSPQSFSLKADFNQNKFKVVVDLPPTNASAADRCQISVVSDLTPRIEQTVHANESANQNQCVAFVDLIPGHRYDVSAAALSENSAQSTKILRSLALEPGFDFNAFGLNIQEVKGTLKLEWPTNETKLEKVRQLWPIIVGNGSMLHVRVDTVSERSKNREGVRQYDTWPEDPKKFVQIDNLKRGACYKIQIYTVTSSGIVSTQKFEELHRISPPSIAVSVENITRNSATMKVTVSFFMSDPLFPVNGDISECSLNIVVLDANGMTVLDKLLSFSELSGILMDGLRPYHTYHLKSKVVCGAIPSQSNSQCPQKFRELADTVFQTNQDRPGPVENLVVQPMNPYSVKLKWAAPMLPNGIITHYVVKISALNGNAETWSINFTASNLSHGNHSAVVDGLIGGLNYNFNVQAVTEAGMGDLLQTPKQVTVTMPVAAPPRPERVEIVSESVHSTEVTVSFNSAAFSTKHGLLTKVALIVAQVGADGRPNDSIPNENLFGNRTATWGRVQNFEFWPPYIALEIPLEPTVQLPIKSFVHTIGLDSACMEMDVNQICNGPLKTGTSYRFKLRLFTSPNMSSDSVYSDFIVTEPLRNNTLRGLFSVLFILICCALLALFLLFVYTRRQRSTSSEKIGHPFASSTPNRFLPRFSRQRTNHAGQSDNTSKESQWAALKMIMAERAAECLSKLGLDSQPTEMTNVQTPNVVYNNQPPQTHLQVGTPTSCSTPSEPNSVQILSNQQQSKEQNSSELNAGGSSPFNAHHRRSRSLRERTGVDQRLERLPSGPPNSKTLNIPWTVIKGTNLDKSRPVRIVDFPEHVRLMSADSDYLFSIEYEEFRFVGNNLTCIAAEAGPNRAKNRFTNILPFDHSRVKLIAVDDEDGSDYINASYISGHSQKREFIAAQGPLPSTRDNFWRLIWEQHCPAIVALTKCMEKGREKCHQYWPDDKNRSVLYGDIEVTLLNESFEATEEYVTRQLRLINLAEPNQQPRNVLHLHYQAWPDFGAPEHPAGIVNFSRIFRSKVPPSPHNRPTIVHCSAGVGRSGTFIALDRLVQNIEIGRPLDVFGIVNEMRMERCYMVQNEQQYIFIHQCLLYVLQHFYPDLISPTSNSLAHTSSSIVPPTPGFWTNQPCTSQQLGGPKAPRIEVQHNPAFLMENSAFVEDDEGIADSSS